MTLFNPQFSESSWKDVYHKNKFLLIGVSKKGKTEQIKRMCLMVREWERKGKIERKKGAKSVELVFCFDDSKQTFAPFTFLCQNYLPYDDMFQLLKSWEKECPYHIVCFDNLTMMGYEMVEEGKAALGWGRGWNKDRKSDDGFTLFGRVGDHSINLLKAIQHLPCLVVVTCAPGKADDIEGGKLIGPKYPGKQTAPMLPHFFDNMFYLRKEGFGEYQVITDSDDAVFVGSRTQHLLKPVYTGEKADLPSIHRRIVRGLKKEQEEFYQKANKEKEVKE